MSQTFDERYNSKLKDWANGIRLNKCPILRGCIAEFFGTLMLIVLGCGVLAQTFLGDSGSKKHGSFISIALGWGLAVFIGAVFAGSNGHGMINPAATLAFAIIGKVPWKRVPFYTLSQVLGAFVGSLLVFAIYYENIMQFAMKEDGGKLLMKSTGNIFVTNPWASITTCFFDQVFGTALLIAGALALIDKNGQNVPGPLHAIHIGMLVVALVGAFALNAGAALNPARDLGPRLMLLMCGWGSEAFTSGNYFFWVPIVGPYIGAVIGAVVYELMIGIHLDRADPKYKNRYNDAASQNDGGEMKGLLPH